MLGLIVQLTDTGIDADKTFKMLIAAPHKIGLKAYQATIYFHALMQTFDAFGRTEWSPAALDTWSRLTYHVVDVTPELYSKSA